MPNCQSVDTSGKIDGTVHLADRHKRHISVALSFPLQISKKSPWEIESLQVGEKRTEEQELKLLRTVR